MRGDFHVRFCERLRVRFPLPTRFASNGKVYRLNKETKQHSLFAILGDETCVIKDVIEYNGSVYVLSHMNGLYECDSEGKVVKHYSLSREYGKSPNAKKLHIDSSNIIWVATQSGLFLLDPQTEEVRHLRSNLHNTYSLPNNSVWSIFPDPDGGVNNNLKVLHQNI